MPQAAAATADMTDVLTDAELEGAISEGNRKNEAVQLYENAKEITQEMFMTGVMKLLSLAVQGYPRALRSTLSRRNEMLRNCTGDQDRAVEDVKAQAAKISEEAKTWLLGAVPFIGLPTSIAYPTWKLLRRACLFAGIYGHDVDSEETRAKIVHVFGGMRAVPATEFAIEFAVQSVWASFVGPIAKVVPVGLLVSKVANIEGAVLGALGQETFSEGRRVVPEEEYNELLDAPPTFKDMWALSTDSAMYALISAWHAGEKAVAIARDGERRASASDQAFAAAKQGAALAQAAVVAAPGVARAAVSAAPGAAAEVQKQAAKGLTTAMSFGQNLIGGKKS